MKRCVDEHPLAFDATVCEDGSPNLSPKGSTYVLDDDHLFFVLRRPSLPSDMRAPDLVCRMELARQAAEASLTWSRRSYASCCDDCLRPFMRNPERYTRSARFDSCQPIEVNTDPRSAPFGLRRAPSL